jgi:putative MATE family efflux protein
MKSEKKKMDMVNGPLFWNIILFAVPVMLTGILQLLFNACDMVVVGRFAGSEALAAVGSTSSLTNLLVNTFLGLSVGANVLTAHSLGAKEDKMTEKIVHTAVTMSLVCGVLLSVIGVCACRWCLTKMGSPENVLDLSVTYMRIYFLGMPALMLYNFGSAILRAQGNTKQPLIFLAIAGAVNVVLNLVLVIMFHLSVAGVAIATIVSQTISAVLVVWWLARQPGPCQLHRKSLGIDRRVLLRIFRIGVPAGFNSMVFSFANVQIQSSINMFGSSAMAGSSAASSLEGFVYTSMNSFHQAALNFTGQNVGAGRYDRVKKILWNCFGIATAVGIIMGFGMYALGRPLLSIYTSDPEDIACGMIRLQAILLTYFLCGEMETVVGVLRGLGYAVVPTIVSLVGACGFRLVWIATAFRMHTTLFVLFISYPISWIVTTIAHFICYAYAMHEIKKRRERAGT